MLTSQVKTVKEKLKKYKNKVQKLNNKVIQLLQENRNYNPQNIKENVQTQNYGNAQNHPVEQFYPIQYEEIPQYTNGNVYHSNNSNNIQRKLHTVTHRENPFSFENNRLIRTGPVVKRINNNDNYLDFASEDINPKNEFYKSLPVDNLFTKTVHNETQYLTGTGQENEQYLGNKIY